MLNLIKNLTSVSGVSGREKAISDRISGIIAPFADKVYNDNMGNLIAVKYGKGENKKKIMLCAHMDEIGFIVTFIEDNGFIRVAPIGGINFVSASYTTVVFENGVKGILVPESGVAPADIKGDKVYVDIGAKDKKEAERKVKIGDCLSVQPSVTRLCGRRIAGRPLDDRIGCAVVIKIAEKLCDKKLENDVYFTFSTQEEVGTRGSKPLAFSIAPDYGLAFDVTGTGDTAGAKPMACAVGDGAAIKIKDNSVICNVEVNEKLMSLAKERDIKHQCEILLYGGTDTSSMQISGCGAKVGALSIPTRYIHSSVEMLDLNDAEACVDLAIAFIEEI